MSRLDGLRVWLTRPNRDAQLSAARWHELGATVLIAPLIELNPLELDPSVHRECLDFDPDWVVLSSTNAAEHFAREFGASNELGSAWRCAAVGSKTAQRAKDVGLMVDLVAARATGRDLARDLAQESDAERCLVPGGDRQRTELPEELCASGVEVLSCVLYENRFVDPDPAVLGQALSGGIDLVSFYSPSAVDSFVAGVAESSTAGIPCAVVGETTAVRVRESGLELAVCPKDPGEAPMLAEVERWWSLQS